MHGLLQQDVAGVVEHPVAELARGHLPQPHIVDAADKVGWAERVRPEQRTQPHERRMMHEILVYSDCRIAPGTRRQKRLASAAACRQRLFYQHRLAGLDQRERHLAMHVRRHQHMRPVEAADIQSLAHRSEHPRSVARAGQPCCGRDVLIDDRDHAVIREV